MGSETAYEIRVQNQGNVVYRDVKVVVQLPDGVQLVDAQGATTAVIQPQQVMFDPLAQLPGRTEAPYRIRVRGQRAGDFSLRVQVGAENLPTPMAKAANLRVNDNTREAAKPAGPAPTSRPPQ